MGGDAFKDHFSRLFNILVDQNVSMNDVVFSSGLEEGASSWRKVLFVWEEDLVDGCMTMLANVSLQDDVEDF